MLKKQIKPSRELIKIKKSKFIKNDSYQNSKISSLAHIKIFLNSSKYARF